LSAIECTRRYRRKFKAEHGYSVFTYYRTGKLRDAVLARDEYKCVKCGMTTTQYE